MSVKSWSKFPESIYVAWEEDGERGYLAAAESFSPFAEIDEDRLVAVYKLVEVKKVKAKATLE